MDDKIYIKDTYLSELSAYGCDVTLHEPPELVDPTRIYYNGELTYNGLSYPCSLIQFRSSSSGNMRLVYVDAVGCAPLLALIEAHKKSHWFPLMIRTIIRWLYYLMLPALCVVFYWNLFHLRFVSCVIGFVLMMLVRLMHVIARDTLGK